MCFHAGKGDSIILEQPELHLHPKVQTRLADFFVSINALGKQCILETHSEYLINRLRYLVAKTDDEKIAKETMIYFVEKEDGDSIYRDITINRYGVIDKWPKGFFDEGEDLATMIMKAGMEKKRRELEAKKG
jgi:predicted ATPase